MTEAAAPNEGPEMRLRTAALGRDTKMSIRWIVAAMAAGGASTTQMMEMFKMRGGRIHEVEAIGFQLPYGAKSGWEAYGQ